MTKTMAILCPGQGAQAVGMGQAWIEASSAAAAVFKEADDVLGDQLGAPLSELCFRGPAERLNQTDASQPALYTCGVASFHALKDTLDGVIPAALAGLSLGEYTALHLAGVFDFATGLKLVALRGRLMQDAAVASKGGMLALIGADEAQAVEVCSRAAEGGVLVPANFNAPGQIVLSGDAEACDRAAEAAGEMELRATPLTVAGAFHSPHMQPAADGMAEALGALTFTKPDIPIWSNVTAEPHSADDPEQIKQLLVEQIVSPVRWAQSCSAMLAEDILEWHELAPGAVLRGLMRRIERTVKVISHDTP
jgi:[acyl-carrier-protein] S-malonyltransferase